MRNLAVVRASVVVLATGLIFVALPTQSSVQAAGPFQYHSLTPCRLADTRNPTGAQGGPALVGQGTPRTFPIQNVCGVPIGAAAVSINVTAVGPNGQGFLTLWPTGITQPTVSNLNFQAGVPALANGAIVPLGTYSATVPYDLSVYSRIVGPGPGETGGTMHLVLDVTGYFQ